MLTPTEATSAIPEALVARSMTSRRFRRDSLLVVASTIAVGVGNYGFSLALIWVLPSHEFSVFAAASTLVVVAATAATSALPWVLSREVARTEPHSQRRRQATGFTLLAALMAGTAAAAVVIALISPYASIGSELAAGASVLAVFVVQVGSGYLQGSARFLILAVFSVVEVIVKTGAGVGLAAGGLGATGALTGAALAVGAWALVGLVCVGRDIGKPTRAAWDSLWRHAASIGGVQVAVVALTTVDVVIGSIRFRGDQGMAGYQAMLVFSRVPLFISGAVSTVAYRRLVAIGTDIAKVVGETMTFYLSIAVAVVATVTTIPAALLGIVLPHGYSSYAHLLLPLGIAGMAAGQINLVTTFFQAEGRIRSAMAVLWPGVGGAAILLAAVGGTVNSLAWASAAADVTVAAVLTVVASRRYRRGRLASRTAGYLILTAALGEAFWVVRPNRAVWLGLAVLSGALTFALLHRLQHVVDSRVTPRPRRQAPFGSVALRRHLLSWVTRAINHFRPLAPPTMWNLILAARSAVGSGPIVAVPTARRVLVLAPHPDDETIGCGGTVALLARSGATVTVAVATSGEMAVAEPGSPAEIRSRRRDEASAACCQLGVAEPIFLDLPDGVLSDHRGLLVGQLARLAERVCPDAVFVPWPLDDHPDHMALASALADVELPDSCEVWSYEVWAALPANRIVDVSKVWDIKLAALSCHASGRGSFDLDSHLALARWRSIFGLSGNGHAEAFLALRSADFRELVKTVSR
jgi:LmbE family N-acetylglucosaminyl deacetylase/O-antigen/teichoic acid export membrane protein